jgi:hypothetical protein
MSATTPSAGSCDAAGLAVSVRDLAHLAHQTLQDPSGGPHAARELTRRIARLQERFPHTLGNPLAVWLENLRRRVEQASHERAARVDYPARRSVSDAGRKVLARS